MPLMVTNDFSGYRFDFSWKVAEKPNQVYLSDGVSSTSRDSSNRMNQDEIDREIKEHSDFAISTSS